jgi:DNA-binding CsgD family transcriptional regulator
MPAPATLILNGEGLPVSWTASFRDWLTVLPGAGEALPAAVHEIGARALRPRDARTRLPNHVRVRTLNGRWAAIEGALLEGSETHQVAITIRDATAAEIFDVLCKVYDLTPRERQLVALARDGLQTKQLAQTLFISPYTVQDHLKAVFAKTGARSRGELFSRLSGRGA